MNLLERAISLVAPHACLGCGAEGLLLCDWCSADALLPFPQRCYKCKEVNQDATVCRACRHRGSKLRHVWIRSEYDGLAKALVYRLKFDSSRAAAVSIAALMGEVIPWLSPETLVVHIPTAATRRRLRGYDHAELLAKQLALSRGLNHQTLLTRLGQSRQVGANRKERLVQLNGAFWVRKTSLTRASSILLVDDITTTGGTLEAAAAALKKAGAKNIDALVFAQKQ